MKSVGLSFVAALVVVAILDALWLGVISTDFYKSRLGALLSDSPIWSAAILFYLIHAAGIAVFAVPAAKARGGWMAALAYGALYGFCVYAAYDLTNQATLRGWPLSLTLVDLAWGAVVTAAATVVAFLVVSAWG